MSDSEIGRLASAILVHALGELVEDRIPRPSDIRRAVWRRFRTCRRTGRHRDCAGGRSDWLAGGVPPAPVRPAAPAPGRRSSCPGKSSPRDCRRTVRAPAAGTARIAVVTAPAARRRRTCPARPCRRGCRTDSPAGPAALLLRLAAAHHGAALAHHLLDDFAKRIAAAAEAACRLHRVGRLLEQAAHDHRGDDRHHLLKHLLADSGRLGRLVRRRRATDPSSRTDGRECRCLQPRPAAKTHSERPRNISRVGRWP